MSNIFLAEVSVMCDSDEIVQPTAKYVAAKDLEDLVRHSAALFGLNSSPCEILSNSGIPVESDDILKLLRKVPGNPKFFIREKVSNSTTCNEENENDDCRSLRNLNDEANPTTSRSQNIEKLDFYPIEDIIKTMKVGKRNSKSAEQVLEHLKNCNPLEFDIPERTLVHKAVGPWLMENCEKKYFPTPNEFEKMAKSIVYHFPAAANKSSEMPWDLWYYRGVGSLERYVRNKRSCSGHSRPNSNHSSKRLRLEDKSVSELELKEAEEFMRRNHLTQSNKKDMIFKMDITRSQRRQLVESGDKNVTATLIVKRFPRLTDLYEVIEKDFQIITGGDFNTFSNNWQKVESNLLDLAKLKVKCERGKQVIESAETAEKNYELDVFSLSILELLLFILPNTLPSQKKSGIKTSECLDLIIQRFEMGHEVADAVKAAQNKKMLQPGIIMIGEDFFIKLDQIPVSFPHHIHNVSNAIACLVAYYYILNVKYPEPLRYVFSFFEHLFELKNKSVNSTVVKSLIANLSLIGSSNTTSS